MNAPQLEQTVRRISRFVVTRVDKESDSELLRAFCSSDESAFGELLKRHGGLVRAVCRRVLGDQAGVDDAWQATFLVLARRASTIVRTGSLAGWLHGVAYRTALRERRASLRRSKHEARAKISSVTSPEMQAAWRELQELVDVEVQRLPAPLREVFVRVCLENAGCNEVAAELRLNEGTVRSRLTRARRALRGRLERKGVCLSAALAILAVSESRVSASLVSSTHAAASVIAADRGLPLGMVSDRAAILASATGRSLAFVPKLVCAVVLMVGIFGMGFAQVFQKKDDAPPPKVEQKIPTKEEQVADADALPANAIARFGTTRFRAGGAIVALAFEPTGKRLASWGGSSRESDQFILWEAGTGKEIRTDRTTSNSLQAFTWTSSGVGLAVVSEQNSTGLRNLTVWEFSAEKPTPLSAPVAGRVRIVNKGANAASEPVVDSVAISADGKRIAVATGTGESGGKPGLVRILEAKSNTSLADLKQLAEFDAPAITCSALAFTPDGKRLVGVCEVLKDRSKSESSKVLVWNADGKIARTIDGPIVSKQGSRLTFAVSNEHAALGMEENGDTLLVDLGSGKARTVGTAHKSKMTGGGYGTFAVAFSPDGKSLATGGRDNMVRVSDVASGKVTRELGSHSSWPEAIAFSADGKRVASSGQDAVIHVWDPIAGKEAVPTGGHPGIVWRASISADSKTVITEGGDGIRIWDAATGAERRRIDAGGNVTYCKLSPDSKHVVAVVGPWESSERALKTWDLATGKEATPAGFPKTLTASGFRFSPDGKTLITYHDEKMNAWAWPAGTKLWATEMPKPANPKGVNQVQSVSFAPDGRQFVTVGERYWFRDERGMRFGYGADGIVDLWDTATGKLIRRLVESQGCFRPGMFAADGLFIHSGGGTLPGDIRGGVPHQTRAQLCAIDPLTGRLVREFGKASRGDGFDSGYTIALSADGKALFRATGLGEVHVYEVASGGYRTGYPGHKASVLALDTPTDVRRVLSGSWDTTALLWNVGFDGKKLAPLSAEERTKQWETLTELDGAKAYDAMLKLAGDPDGLIALAKAELKPAPEGPKPEDLAPLYRDLDSKAFNTREAASAKLDKFGEGAIGLVRARLDIETSPEARTRLKRFLEQWEGPANAPTRFRQSRVVELLEHLGTAEVKVVLEKLARGGSSYMTSDAAGALKRIESR